jgi:hypothetical protein
MFGMEDIQTGTGSAAWEKKLYVGTDGVVRYYSWDGGPQHAISSASTYADNRWHHAVGTQTSGSNIKLYVDGVLQQTTVFGTSYTGYTNSYFRIGAYEGTAGATPVAGVDGYFPGLIDDVRVYNRALSAQEIKRLYELGATSYVNVPIATNPDLQTGLVGHWTFDGPKLIQNATDSSGQGNTGYLTNFTSTTTAPGVIGQALQFDGVNDNVEAPTSSSLAFAGPVSLSAWVFPRVSNVYQAIIVRTSSCDTRQFGYFLSQGGTTQLFVSFGDAIGGLMTVSPGWTVNAWNHVVVVANGSDWRGYINGVHAGTSVASGVNTATAASTYLGLDQRCGNYRLNGFLDDARVYNRALSAQEIKRLYELGATTKVGIQTPNPNLRDGLVGHWPLDGLLWLNNAPDESGRGNTGYLANFTSTTTVPGNINQALRFDGTDSGHRIDATSSATTDPVTLCIWFSLAPNADIFDNTAQSDTIMGIYSSNVLHAFGLGLSNPNSGQARLVASQLDNTSGSGVSALSSVIFWTEEVGKWHHACGVFVSDTLRYVYWDGRQTGSDTGSRNTSGTTLTMIGGSAPGNGQAAVATFEGDLDDARVWNRALSPDEIKRLYELGR